MKVQSIRNIRGEVSFRRLLALQHVTGEVLLPDYFGKQEHDAILAARIETTRVDMKRLAGHGVNLSPFLEFGAERCHRSMVMVNDHGAEGIAVDISLDQLRTAPHFAAKFGMSKLPLRVCCDVNHLPIRDRAVPLVFCYEFLHHFPNITPIVAQAYRILVNGYFFFNEEPFKRPRLALYRQRSKIYSKRVLRKGRFVRTLEKFISEPWSDELEHGIIENDRISLAEWIDALSVFDTKTVKLASVGGKITSRLGEQVRWRNLANQLLGGGISGLCVKRSVSERSSGERLEDLLLCPNCIAGGHSLDQAPMIHGDECMACSVCGAIYPVVDGVVLLLDRAMTRELYPAYASLE